MLLFLSLLHLGFRLGLHDQLDFKKFLSQAMHFD